MTLMKAIRIHEYGPASVLRHEDAQRPEPGAGEVLVRVIAAGVNPIDWKVRAGLLKAMLPLSLPWVPGLDFSGVVERVGSDVKSFAKGDDVFGKTDLPRDGSYAEFVAVPASGVVRKPSKSTHAQAAAIPLAALTAFQGLFGGGLELRAGQSVLVLGAAGGIGSFAVQLAKWKGARVIAAGRAAQAGHLSALGADLVVDTGQKELAAAGEVDAVLDLVGGELQQRAWQQLKRGGALASTMGAPSAAEAAARAARGVAVSTHTNAQELGVIATLVEAGTVKVFVTKTLPLASAREAHELLEGHGVVGKVVLSVG